MRLRNLLRFALLSFVSVACATAEDTAPEDGTGGTLSGTGGDVQGTGGFTGSTGGVGGNMGGSFSTGGVFGVGGTSATGGTDPGGDTGGTTSTGGTSSGTGGMSSGTGGSGTGGTLPVGECAELPTYAEWKVSSPHQMGDQVRFACTKVQAGCAGKMIGTEYIFACNDSHLPNCETQSPDDGSAWLFVGDCE